MKNFSDIVTLVAAGALIVTAGILPAAAADRPSADATRPNYQYTPNRAERPPQSGAHADYHIDARVGTPDRTDRDDRSDPRLRDDPRDERRDSRSTSGAERSTRPMRQGYR